jgi:hypothetical protein
LCCWARQYRGLIRRACSSFDILMSKNTSLTERYALISCKISIGIDENDMVGSGMLARGHPWL